MSQVDLLPEGFLKQYKNQPDHMNLMGQFVYYRTYSRYLEEKGRREYWKETVRRSTLFNIGLKIKHGKKHGITFDPEELQRQAQTLFDDMWNLRRFLSGRTLWVGGANNGLAERYALANFNCAFTNIRKWSDLVHLFYLLMVGAGAGFKVTQKFAKNLPMMRKDIEVIHKEFNGVIPELRAEDTTIHTLSADEGPTNIELVIGDSKEGWVQSLEQFFDIMTSPKYHKVKTLTLNYDNIRLKGERLKTFGGTASGHESILEMYKGIVATIQGQLDPDIPKPYEIMTGGRVYVKLRPIHIMDMANLIGKNVVVGGVRRTAEIYLFDANDTESMFAKYGINGFWEEKHFENHAKIEELLKQNRIKVPSFFNRLGVKYYSVFDKEQDKNVFFPTRGEAQFAYPDEYVHYPANPGRSLEHRRMSNNSIAFTEKPTDSMMDLLMALMQLEGEPGFINLREAAIRRLKASGVKNPSEAAIIKEMELIGLNPCAEILLRDKGVCNLSTVNTVAFVKDGVLDVDAMIKAIEANVEACTHMTLIELELAEWDETQKQDRLLGISMTGWKDAMGYIGASKSDERKLLRKLGKAARDRTTSYALELGINRPLLATTVKPEGTQSQVAGGVSSGLHESHSPHYIRRVRINANDPLAKTIMYLGWPIEPEVGTEGETRIEKMKNASTLVTSFLVKSGATKTKDDISADEQLDTYFMFQEEYTDHNSSNTITVKPHEWDSVGKRILRQWDEFVAVSFLAHDGGTYQLAPYEAISEERYNDLLAKEDQVFYPEALVLFENGEDFDIEEACKDGACAPR